MASIRLICPNCGATYEIDASAIPEQGRDVQCSNCAHIWFEEPDNPTARAEDPFAVAPDSHSRPEDEEPEAAPEPPISEGGEDAAEEDASPFEEGLGIAEEEDSHASPTGDAGSNYPDAGQREAPVPEEMAKETATGPTLATPRRTLDSSIAEILREEAAREEAARRAEDAGQDTFETQEDLTLDPPARIEPEERPDRPDPPARLARLRGEADTPVRGGRSDVFPDIEEINSSFDRPRGTDFMPEEEDSKSGGRAGFFTVLALIGLAVLVYATAPWIAEAVPALADPLASYVETVDTGRIWLDEQVRALADMMGAG